MLPSLRHALFTALAIAWSVSSIYAQKNPYEVGGPLAGIKLPLFPTQQGEPAGKPGNLEGYPIHDLYPGSIELYHSGVHKNLPARSFWDRQSQIKIFTVQNLSGIKPEMIEQYAAPIYQVPRYGAAVKTDKSWKPVSVVRCKVGSPVLELNLGELEPSLYVIRVIGAVETAKYRVFREPLYLSAQINDGLKGETRTYRLRIGYVDEFYSVAEFYFHALEKRAYKASIQVDAGSKVDLLVHNISLDDQLAGSIRKPLKTRQTIHTAENLAAARNEADPKAMERIKERPVLSAQERLDRDQAIWNWMPPLNAQGMAALNALIPYPTGSADKSLADINKEFGEWKPVETRDHSLGIVLSYNTDLQDALLENTQLGLKYTMSDYRAGKPLPDPYPYKDNGTGLYFPDPANPKAGKILALIAPAIQNRYRTQYFGMGGLKSSYSKLIYQSEHPDLLRDAAVSLIRYAWIYPTLDSANMLAEIALGEGFSGLDLRARNRDTKANWTNYDGYEGPIFDYDLLFPYIKGNEELAKSIGRFIPWVKTSDDLIKLLDVYLVQYAVKRTMRYHDHTIPTAMVTFASAIGDNSVTEPWMQWLFSRTYVYPLPPAGLQDVLISGHDRHGAQNVASVFYATGEGASRVPAALEMYLRAGGNPKYDLSNSITYPKPLAHCYWIMDVMTAGADRIRIGDVNGPSMRQNLPLNESTCRLGWQWSKDPKFAWILANVYGRKSETDQEWVTITKAAQSIARAPWLENRSRAIENWAGVLESGTAHDDFRFRRSVMVRTGAGTGHQHNDALDLQVFAHGMSAVMDGGQRGGYSEPNDRNTRIHNLVEIDGKDHLAYGWVQTLSDAPGARYLNAVSFPPPNTDQFRRQTALIDADPEPAARKLAISDQIPGKAKLPLDVKTPNSYAFDVFRASGGTVHSYCFHGTVNDKLDWNVQNIKPVPHQEKESPSTATEQEYLSMFQLSAGKKFAGDAPDLLQATWRQIRFENDTKGGVSEQSVLGDNFNPNAPYRFTRWHLFGTGGRRALTAPVMMHKTGYQWDTAMVMYRAEEGKPLTRAYPALIEPYIGEPFISTQNELTVQNNESDALRAVALQVQTTQGFSDLCFADGRPEKMRELAWDQGKAVQINGEFAFLRVNRQGNLQAATLSGGQTLKSEQVSLQLAQARRQARIVKVDYARKTMWIDQAWPAGLAGQVIQIQEPGCPSSYTIKSVTPEDSGSRIELLHGADFYRSQISQVLPEQKRVDGLLPVAPGRPSLKGMTASNDSLTKVWRVVSHKGNDFYLEGGLVEHKDFAPDNALRLWEYGVGDTISLASFVGLRNLGNSWEVTGNTDVQVTLKGQTPWTITASQLSENQGVIHLSSDGKILTRTAAAAR